MDFCFLGSPSRPQPRRRGRPPAEEPKSTISAWIPAAQHDQLVRIAHQRGESVSQVVRTIVTRALTPARTS